VAKAQDNLWAPARMGPIGDRLILWNTMHNKKAAANCNPILVWSGRQVLNLQE